MFHVAPFRARDYLEVAAWSALASLSVTDVDPLKTARTWEQGGPGYTGRLDGAVAVCGGMLIPWTGLGLAWARISPLGRAHPRLVSSTVARHLRQTIKEHRLRRVEAEVPLTFGDARRWAVLLGFEEDGVAKAFLPDGGDAMRYVLLPSTLPEAQLVGGRRDGTTTVQLDGIATERADAGRDGKRPTGRALLEAAVDDHTRSLP